MDNKVTNLGIGTGTQGTVFLDVAYHSGYALLSLIEMLKGAPDMIKQIGIQNYATADLNGLYNELDKFVNAFEPVAQKKVS
jgi:hypothetical protein